MLQKVSLKPTKKELAILVLVADGLSNLEIAETFKLSERTIGSHIQNLFIKTGCKSRFTLVLYFIRNGTLKPIGTTDRIKELELQVSQLQKERAETIAQLQKMRRECNQSISEILNQLVG
jgi:DNA-binding CsgD family transcriptional regulator